MPKIDLAQLKDRAGSLLDGFTRGQKTMLAVAIGAALLGAVVFLQWASAPSWAPLYSGLPGTEAASVTQELDAMGVQYKLEGGDTILVHRDAVYQARLDLSAKGLPADGAPGYDLLDDQGITTSQFKQRVDYQRALEGELVRTIEAIDGVEAADVHLVIPEDDLFTEDPVRPTASVLVRTAPDATLTSGQVRSVVHLVASSVEGLQATDITVADHTGRMLAEPGEDGLAAGGSDIRTGQTAAFESGLARSIEELVAPIAGPGRARVQVSADLDFDERQTTSETFGEPESAPVVQESTTNETYAGTGGAVGGVLGPDAIPVTDATGSGTDYEKEQADRVYAVSKVTEQVEKAPGDVRRLSVAVLLDDDADVNVNQLTSLVAAAAGIDADRGDRLEVTQLAFDDSALPSETPELGPGGEDSPMVGIIRVAGVVGIVALVLLLSYRSARRSSVARYPLAIPLDPLQLAAGTVRELDDEDEDGHRFDEEYADELDLSELERATEGELPSPVQDQLVVQSQIGDLIDRQPDEVAQVLRAWLADRRG